MPAHQSVGNILNLVDSEVVLAGQQSEPLQNLGDYLRTNVDRKLNGLVDNGHSVGILNADWCRDHPAEAGRLHADIIVATYGSTYALPNKDPLANEQAINGGGLDVYLLTIDESVVGTACLVDAGEGRAELGRSASLGRVGNSIIQDLRIMDWLSNPLTAEKYHTLFTTLRTAPDREIDESDGSTFIMRGGQGVTEHWRKFPKVYANGVAPLYLKHGKLEQFTLAYITRNAMDRRPDLYVSSPQDARFIGAWHNEYGVTPPSIIEEQTPVDRIISFTAHYPSIESGITELVHADIVPDHYSSKTLVEALGEAYSAGSPFYQVSVPIELDTRAEQERLRQMGYQVFGYQPADSLNTAALLYGKVRDGINVVPTFWDIDDSASHPFWQNSDLRLWAENVACNW